MSNVLVPWPRLGSPPWMKYDLGKLLWKAMVDSVVKKFTIICLKSYLSLDQGWEAYHGLAL